MSLPEKALVTMKFGMCLFLQEVPAIIGSCTIISSHTNLKIKNGTVEIGYLISNTSSPTFVGFLISRDLGLVLCIIG